VDCGDLRELLGAGIPLWLIHTTPNKEDKQTKRYDGNVCPSSIKESYYLTFTKKFN
jgi:hypothetical protein